MKKIIKKFIKMFFCIFIKIEKGKILMLQTTPYSGCNSNSLYKYIKENTKYNKIKLVDISKKTDDFKQRCLFLREYLSSEIIITTHSAIKQRKNQKIIQLWHGIPLKAMGLLDLNICNEWNKNDRKTFNNVDLLVSTSEIYNTLFNSTIGQVASKYKILGYPRNDLLLSNENKIKKIFNVENMNVIFYIPTFRIGYSNRIEGKIRKNNIFEYENFDEKKFGEFLKCNNILLVAKLHPFEEAYYTQKLNNLKIENLVFLKSKDLKKYKTDLYELLAESKMLITDYSSIYFDYLLTQKPIIFSNPDINEYKKTRGFLLEPYDFWTPGPKVSTQNDLQKQIIESLKHKTYYEQERTNMLEVFHEYKDAKSCERVWNFIRDQYIERNY